MRPHLRLNLRLRSNFEPAPVPRNPEHASPHASSRPGVRFRANFELANAAKFRTRASACASRPILRPLSVFQPPARLSSRSATFARWPPTHGTVACRGLVPFAQRRHWRALDFLNGPDPYSACACARARTSNLRLYPETPSTPARTPACAPASTRAHTAAREPMGKCGVLP